ncbi:MAG: Hsp70 family protein [Deltaproteobacteria bacterium]|nr:Hsp70 family protein [Deltaproteobacteria bacterium]
MAIDFGTSNTIVAFWNEEKHDVDLYAIEDVTLPFTFEHEGRNIEIPYIPSMICYRDKDTNFIGAQVIDKMLENSKGSFRWLKAYIQSRRKINYPLSDGTTVDYFTAGRDFIEKILSFAADAALIDLASGEVVFTVPVESFEYYTDWLSSTCIDLGIKRYRFLDESSACVFGYETQLQKGDIYLIFDFGGGTLDVSVIQIEEQVDRGIGCRVMGKAGCRIGGRTIDGWLYGDILKRASMNVLDAREASALFMRGVEEIKENLTSNDEYTYEITHELSGLRLKGKYKRSELEDLLEHNGLYHNIQETIERALKHAYEKGIEKSSIKEALLVGGSSQIPSIRRQVRTMFGARTKYFRPYDAVARGACRFLSSDIEDLYDHIQHDYAIKSYNRKTGTHEFLPLIPRGTQFPTETGLKKMTMKATRDGQRFFGIDIFEIAEKVSNKCVGEIVYDMNGCAVFDDNHKGSVESNEFWMNENSPTFIEASPPGEKGIKRFSVSFRVDPNKALRVTVRDIFSQKLLYEDYPVVRLK